MPQVIDIQKEMDTCTFLVGRHVDTPPEELEAAFATLAHYRDGGIFAGGFSGVSRWERHRNGDEIVHVLGGVTLLTIMHPTSPNVFLFHLMPHGLRFKMFAEESRREI